MLRAIWVSELHISSRVAQKISSKHRLRTEDVRQAIVGVAGLRARRDTSPERGLRYLTSVEIDGHPCVAVLYPTDRDEETFALGSVYRVRAS